MSAKLSSSLHTMKIAISPSENAFFMRSIDVAILTSFTTISETFFVGAWSANFAVTYSLPSESVAVVIELTPACTFTAFTSMSPVLMSDFAIACS